MSRRTWAQNAETMNGLWPQCSWTDEEIGLWRSDFSGCDQDLVHQALLQVKRSRDSLYPQLAWVHEAYRELSSKARAARPAPPKPPAFSGDRLEIDPADEREARRELEALLEATPAESLGDVESAIWRSLHRLHSVTAMRLQAAVDAKRRGARPEAEQPAPPEAKRLPRRGG